MRKPAIKTTKPATPMIYAYTTPGISYHDGYIKIGYTEQDVDKRIYEQTHTAGVKPIKKWAGMAVFDDGSGEVFRDHDFHVYLRKNGIEQPMDKGNEYFDKDDINEWFYVSPSDSRGMFFDFRSNHGVLEETQATIPYLLRSEQEEAVDVTLKYREEHENGEFLWNAKPRFGKTLAAYDLCKRINAKTVLIVTNRPAIANSWYSDYEKFIGREAGYFFVSNIDALKTRPYVLSYEQYAADKKKREADPEAEPMGMINFVSLQDLKGSTYFGGQYDKLKYISRTNWDLLIIDEAHEGVDTYKTDVAFDRIKRKFTLHLSGTPFKALANAKFDDNAIFNYTYADEQKKKADWNEESAAENPYAELPRLNLYTYQMSEIIKDEISRGVEINGETEEYAFDLNEFFRVENKKFVYNSSVDKFLDSLVQKEKYPFSTPELRNELKHTFWLLDRVESARALADKLRKHPVFKDYEIVLAAGDGKIDDDSENEKSYDKVVKAIQEHEKTITISVGQLTTGVTIPEWTAVIMLCNLKSPSLYMQAAFRAQNPCLFREGTKYRRKENSYVFDFDPARTLIIFEEFANDLSSGTSGGRGGSEERKQNVRELLNFFPVIGEDENGEMVELDAEKVLTIPRKIKSVEVVRRGFMSNFLFQNISNVFGAPQEVIDIIEKFEPMDEGKINISKEIQNAAPLNQNGEIELPDNYINEKTNEIFGSKIYDVKADVEDIVSKADDKAPKGLDTLKNNLKKCIKNTHIKDIVEKTKEKYKDEIKASDIKKIERTLIADTDKLIEKSVDNYKIEKNTLENERKESLQNRFETGRTTEDIDNEFDKKLEDKRSELQSTLNTVLQDYFDESPKETTKTIETKIEERKHNSIESGIRDHLRGFTRTIPSFLMAYGDENTTLDTFDKIIPDDVFKEVTSISLEQFQFLRDGGPYTDSETGEERHFEGQLFDSVVFDDSVKEFLSLKDKLSDYFDDSQEEDIFDYIPPQKTNQIFTPKKIVRKMVDMLEQESPGCFDDPDFTFMDPYMKSGLYIAEIVKRLYNSKNIMSLYPDSSKRLEHIFEKQVYGLAPTEIIYRIVLSFVFGFDKDGTIKKHNLKQADALPYAKKKKLEELIDELYDE